MKVVITINACNFPELCEILREIEILRKEYPDTEYVINSVIL